MTRLRSDFAAVLQKLYKRTGKLFIKGDSDLNDYICIYARRKVRIGTIPELSCAKWEFSLCPPIPQLYRTILELRKGYRLYIDLVYVPAQSGNSWTKREWAKWEQLDKVRMGCGVKEY